MVPLWQCFSNSGPRGPLPCMFLAGQWILPWLDTGYVERRRASSGKFTGFKSFFLNLYWHYRCMVQILSDCSLYLLLNQCQCNGCVFGAWRKRTQDAAFLHLFSPLQKTSTQIINLLSLPSYTSAPSAKDNGIDSRALKNFFYRRAFHSKKRRLMLHGLHDCMNKSREKRKTKNIHST